MEERSLKSDTAVHHRMREAQHRGLHPWQGIMAAGVLLWIALFLNQRAQWLPESSYHGLHAAINLIAGLTILQGACEAFVKGVERLGARFCWNGFISGTIGSLVATLRCAIPVMAAASKLLRVWSSSMY